MLTQPKQTQQTEVVWYIYHGTPHGTIAIHCDLVGRLAFDATAVMRDRMFQDYRACEEAGVVLCYEPGGLAHSTGCIDTMMCSVAEVFGLYQDGYLNSLAPQLFQAELAAAGGAQ